MTPIRIIRSETEYEEALAEFEAFFDNEPEVGSAEGDRFELLGLVLHEYEAKQHPINPPTPAEAIRFRMEQSGRKQADLAALFNSRSRASEVLAGKRPLTLDQIRLLHKKWGIPLASLVGELEDA